MKPLTAIMLLLAGVCAAPAAGAQNDSTFHGAGLGRVDGARRVIDAAAIREAGATRLADILLLIEDWSAATIDGFTWQMSPLGLDAYQTQPWIVMVDGVRQDIDLFGVNSINRLPLGLSEIDSVEIIDTPRLHQGEFVDAGLIHFHTHHSDAAGAGAEGAVLGGNPTGDPGPYRYTEYDVPNVDKIGPDFFARAMYRTAFVGVAAGYAQRRHYPTGNETRRRNIELADGAYPQINVYAPSARADARFLGGAHRVFAGHSKFEDFFFFKPYGREIPVTTHYTTGGINGGFDRGAKTGVTYRLAYSRNRIEYRRNSFDLDFDWEKHRLNAGLELAVGGPDGTAPPRHHIGCEAEYVRAETGYSLSDDNFMLAKIYGDTRIQWTPDIGQMIAAAMTGGGSDAAVSAVTVLDWRLRRDLALETAVAYVERLPEQDGRIWFWRERGYDFLSDAGVDVTADAPLGTARRWSVDASLRSSPSGDAVPVAWRLDAYYRGFADQYIEDQRFAFDPDEAAFGGPVRLVAGQHGDVLGCQAVVTTRQVRRVRLRSVYRYQRWVSGDAAFEHVWDTVPRHHFRQFAAYTPVPGFTLWGQLNYTSGSTWYDYRDAAEQSGGLYTSDVDGFITVDAAVEKWFWGRRLRGSLLFKDLLNQSPRYHPIGASSGLSAFVQLEMMVGTARR